MPGFYGALPRPIWAQPSGWYRLATESVTQYRRFHHERCREVPAHSVRAGARIVPRVLPGVLERHVAPYHEQWEKDKIVDRGVWLEAGKQGFLGMAVPEEYGGGGNPDFRYNTIVCEETVAGRYSGIGFSLHNDVVAPISCGSPTKSRSSAGCPSSVPAN